MKRFFYKIKAFSIKLNMLIVSLLLAAVYVFVVMPYSLVFKKDGGHNWIERNKAYTNRDLRSMW
jgi:hypothetical protein